MQDGKLTVAMTRTEAEELHCLLEWTNDPQFRGLSWRVMESINAAEDAKTNRTSTDDMQAPSAGSLPPTEQTER